MLPIHVLANAARNGESPDVSTPSQFEQGSTQLFVKDTFLEAVKATSDSELSCSRSMSTTGAKNSSVS